MKRVTDIKRLLMIHMSRYDYGTFVDIYGCEKLPTIIELRKDYWQEIQLMPYDDRQTKYHIENGTLISERDEDGVERFRGLDFAYGCERTMVLSYTEESEAQINIRGDVEAYIIFPDWETKDLTISIDGVQRYKIHGDVKTCDRYISAFCLTPSNGKLYKTSGCTADFKEIKK